MEDRLPPGGELVADAGRGPIVVVAGLPGAGKSTALRGLACGNPPDGGGKRDGGNPLEVGSMPDDATIPHEGPGGSLVVDSATVRRRLRARLPVVPYALLRPLVHAVHWVRVAVFAVRENRALLIHETATRPLARAVLAGLSRLGRRPLRLVWIEVPSQAAREGQERRGRIIRRRAFRRHLRRIGRRHPAVAARNWDAVYRTDRAGAAQSILTALSENPAPNGRARIDRRT